MYPIDGELDFDTLVIPRGHGRAQEGGHRDDAPSCFGNGFVPF